MHFSDGETETTDKASDFPEVMQHFCSKAWNGINLGIPNPMLWLPQIVPSEGASNELKNLKALCSSKA